MPSIKRKIEKLNTIAFSDFKLSATFNFISQKQEVQQVNNHRFKLAITTEVC